MKPVAASEKVAAPPLRGLAPLTLLLEDRTTPLPAEYVRWHPEYGWTLYSFNRSRWEILEFPERVSTSNGTTLADLKSVRRRKESA